MKMRLPRWMIFPKFTDQCASSLFNHIVHVVLMSPQLQMIRIAATFVAYAGVENIKTVRHVLFMM